MSYKLCYICADFYNRVSVDNKLRVQEHRVHANATPLAVLLN